MRNLLICVLFMSLSIQIIQAQQSPAPFVTQVYDDIYQVMHTRQSPEKPNLVLSENTREIALFSPSSNQIAVGQDFIELARSFGKDSMNVIAQIMSHELAHVLLEQSTIIKNIGSRLVACPGDILLENIAKYIITFIANTLVFYKGAVFFSITLNY